MERKRHDNQSQKHKDTPVTNDIAVDPAESVKQSAPGHSLQDNLTKVDVTKKQVCAEEYALVKTLRAEEDKVLQADSQKPNETLNVKVDNLLQASARITIVAHEPPVVEVTHIKDLIALRDSLGDSKHLECPEKRASKNFDNETFCEKHDSTIRGQRE